MNVWKTIAGVILLVAGVLAAVQGYSGVLQCGPTYQLTTTPFCYNTELTELGGIIVALIGMIVIFYGNPLVKTARKR
jgi:hypothetical protein